jgi:hypothetical protein
MAAMPTFADRLQQKIHEHSPLCVGVDPSAALLKACGLPDAPEGALASACSRRPTSASPC